MTPAEGSALDLAVRRLDRAVAQLEQRQAAKAVEVERALAAAAAAAAPAMPLFSADEPGLFDQEERVRLVADLEAAREREKALEEAGEQASVALGRAIAEIRAALGDEAVANDHHHEGPGLQEGGVAPGEDDELFDDPEEA